jgi:hypothetical protein
MLTVSTGTPRRRDASSASDACIPWPISTELVNTSRLASSLSLAEAVEVDGVTVLLMMHDRPFARTLDPSRAGAAPPSQPIHAAARPSRSRKCASYISSPVITRWPSTSRFFIRSSSGSSPSFSAIMSICVSYAQAACEMP